MTDIKVGDIVQVVSPGQTYSTFKAWADRNGLTNYAINKTAPRAIGKVVAVAVHTPGSGSSWGREVVVGVEIGSDQYIIGVQGVALVEVATPDSPDMAAFKAACAKVRAAKAAYEAANAELVAAVTALTA